MFGICLILYGLVILNTGNSTLGIQIWILGTIAALVGILLFTNNR